MRAWLFPEFPLVLLGILRIAGNIWPTQQLRRRHSVVDVGWLPLKTDNCRTWQLRHLWYDLYTAAAIANHCNSLVAVVVCVIPVCGVCFLALEVMKPRDGGPLPVAELVSGGQGEGAWERT